MINDGSIEYRIWALGRSGQSLGIYDESTNTIKYIEEEVAGFRVDSVTGRGDSTITITETEIGNSNGAKYRYKKDSTKDLTVSFNIVNSEHDGLHKAISNVRTFLDGEEVRFVFSDEPTVYWTGTISSFSYDDIDATGSGVYAASGSLTIHCTCPYKYSVTKTVVNSSTNQFANQVQLINSGSIPVPLTILAKMKSNTKYLGFSLDKSTADTLYWTIGTASNVDSTSTSSSVQLINDRFYTRPDNWTMNSGVLPPIPEQSPTMSGEASFKKDTTTAGQSSTKGGTSGSVEVGLTTAVHKNWDGSNNGFYSSARITQVSQNQQAKTSTIQWTFTARYYCAAGYYWGGTSRGQAGYLDLYVDGKCVKTMTMAVWAGWVNDQLIGSYSGTVTVTHNSDGNRSVNLQLKCRSGNDPLNGGVYYNAGDSSVSTLKLTRVATTTSTTTVDENEGYMYPTSYGSGSSWHGPSFNHLIKRTDGIKVLNWNASWRFDFNNDGASNPASCIGLQAVVFANGSDPYVSIVYVDRTSSNYSELQVFIGTKKYVIGGSDSDNLYHVNGATGQKAAFVVKKNGNDLNIVFNHEYSEGGYNAGNYNAFNCDKHYTLPNSDTEITSVTLYMARYGEEETSDNTVTNPPVQNNLFRKFSFTADPADSSTSTSTWTGFQNGSTVDINGNDNVTYVNGVKDWSAVDISSDVLMLYPGTHTLKYSAETSSTEGSPEITVAYREGWK